MLIEFRIFWHFWNLVLIQGMSIKNYNNDIVGGKSRVVRDRWRGFERKRMVMSMTHVSPNDDVPVCNWAAIGTAWQTVNNGNASKIDLNGSDSEWPCPWFRLRFWRIHPHWSEQLQHHSICLLVFNFTGKRSQVGTTLWFSSSTTPPVFAKAQSHSVVLIAPAALFSCYWSFPSILPDISRTVLRRRG